MVRRVMLVAGLVLVASGSVLTTQFDNRWRPAESMPANSPVDVFSDRTASSFRALRSGHYAIWLTAEQNRPYAEVYCHLRAPTDYWAAMACDRAPRFSADWAVRENYRIVAERKMTRSPAGISTLEENGKTYVRRHLGQVALIKGRYYTIVLTVHGVDVTLRDSHPRLQVRVDETEVDAAGWESLFAMICAPIFILGGGWMVARALYPAR